MTDIDVALDAHAVIGESPIWSPEEQALYWIDIKKPALHRYVPKSGACRSWPLNSDVGAFALCGDGSAVVALRHGLYRLDLSTGAHEMVAPPPFDPALFRFNEGICDRTGRFWVGVMFDPVAGSPSPQRAALHSFTFAGGLRPEHHESQLHNGMAFTEGDKQLFLTDSYQGVIYVIEFDAASGTLGFQKKFARIPTNFGLPDGAAIDVEGYYWCAIHGAGRVRRYAPDGAVDRDILLPVSKPTMCAFAGDDLETMYVTSASEGIEIANEPLAGALLRFRPGVSGIPRSFLRPK